MTRTRRGVRLEQGDAVLSEVLRRPGPTHSVFDVLAAIVRTTANEGGRVALLGFAGGGIVAPLRSMGWDGPLDAVDLDDRGAAIYRELSEGWGGTVRLWHAEAGSWLRGRRTGYDLIVDDLSLTIAGAMTKPALCYTTLPELVARRLRRGGVWVVNALPVDGLAWPGLIDRVSGPWRCRRVVLFDDFENRVLIAGQGLPPARFLGAAIREALRAAGSRLASAISVRGRDPGAARR